MPKDIEYMIDFAAMMRNDQAFPNPTEFNPERFLGNKMHGRLIRI